MFNLQYSSEGLDALANVGLFLAILLLVTMSSYAIKFVSQKIKKKEASEYYEKIEGPISEFDIQQSGIEKNIQLIYSLAIIDDFYKNERHIIKHLNNFDGHRGLQELRRRPLAMYLYVKINLLKEAGISCHLEIDNYFTPHKIKDYALLQALDILIDNAVEALQDRDNEIYINITSEKDNVISFPLIEVLNKHKKICYSEEEQLYGKGFTTKKGKKGLGLYKLNKLARDNDFNVLFGNQEINGENYVSFGVYLNSETF